LWRFPIALINDRIAVTGPQAKWPAVTITTVIPEGHRPA
jgi:hypothetical protein